MFLFSQLIMCFFLMMIMMMITDKKKQVDISGQAKVKNSIGTAEN